MQDHTLATAHNSSVKRATFYYQNVNVRLLFFLQVACYTFMSFVLGVVIGTVFFNYCLFIFLHYLPNLSAELCGKSLFVRVYGSLAQETPGFKMAHSREYLGYTSNLGEKFST